MNHADYNVVAETEDTVFIEDLDLGNKSVTNDAEWVVGKVLSAYGNKKIAYKDTMDQWDELIHDGNVFLDFGPWKGTIPELL